MYCLKCGATAPEGARFCEIDGTPLAQLAGESPTAAHLAPAGRPGCRCGAEASAIDEQGYCQECGRFCGNQERDHIEVVIDASFAGVTDRGRRHSQNEDDMALTSTSVLSAESGTAHILVVCDGVSSSQTPEQASRTGCTVALQALNQALQGVWEPDRVEDTMRDAIHAANRAVCDLPHTEKSTKDPPEATIVAALVHGGIVTVGWVGDSRAYWFGQEHTIAQQLTHDHSWINEVVDAGEMSEAEASVSPGAHAITRCLGVPDADNEDGSATEPGIARFALPGAGILLLCSDGLWNYAPHGEDIATLLRQMPPDADAVTQARTLVEFANAQGGRDNITVAIAQFKN